jgi:SWIM zinc finger
MHNIEVHIFILKFTEPQIQSLAPDEASLKAGKSLSAKSNWLISQYNDRAVWGEIKGSGAKPYLTQIDINNIAFKCSCPSRKFPCKHGLGLMLLWTNDTNAVTKNEEEPTWVADWMNKRIAKEEKVNEPKEYTDEELAKQEKTKLKRSEDRTLAVENGIAELTLVLKDIIRTGILNLPQKDVAFFDKIAARMIDAKASGLAAWVKKLGAINYNQNGIAWQKEALETMGKMYLLTEAYRNINNQSELWQTSIKNLIGWSQAPKELLQDDTAEIVKDIWLVIGQETSTTDDGITIQRNWLLGVQTNETALILNFGTRFAPMDISVIAGSIIEAALVFFPAVVKQRAIIKLQKGIVNNLQQMPNFLLGITALYEYKHNIIVKYPFATDIVVCLKNIRIGQHNEAFIAIDEDGFYMPLSIDFSFEKQLNWLAITSGNYFALTAVIREEKLFPLGVFKNEQYILI